MQYKKDTILAFDRKDLKKRLEEIQGEVRYVSYTAELVARELNLLSCKIEELLEELAEEELLDWAEEQS